MTAQYTRANGYEADCEVIYGDTDSVMVHFRVRPPPENLLQGRHSGQFMRLSRLMLAYVRRPFAFVYHLQHASAAA